MKTDRRPMRIGMVTTSFPRHAQDTAGRFVLEMSQALAQRGHQVQVLAPEPAALPAPATGCIDPVGADAMAPPRGIDVRWVPYLRPRHLQRTFYGAGVPDNLRQSASAWLGLAPFMVQLARAVRDASRAWDAVISHWALPSAWITAQVAARLPHLAVVHSADLHLLERLPWRAAWARASVGRARAVVCVAPSLRQRLLCCLAEPERTALAARCHAIPMGTWAPPTWDVPRNVLRQRLGLQRFTMLSIARLVPIKNLEAAIHACAGDDHVELVVLGDGPERAHLQRLAQEQRARVRFEGRCVGAAKAQWLHAADAYLCCSRATLSGRSEGMPHAVVEALAAGLPTIASRMGGLGDWLRHGRDAWLLDDPSPAAIAQALSSLRIHPALAKQLAEGGRARAAQWQWPTLIERFEALLDPALPLPLNQVPVSLESDAASLTPSGACLRG